MKSLPQLSIYISSYRNARRFAKKASSLLEERETSGLTDDQFLFCVIGRRILETVESAFVCASRGFCGQAYGQLRSVFEGLACSAIIARRPQYSSGIRTFELADRLQAFRETKRYGAEHGTRTTRPRNSQSGFRPS